MARDGAARIQLCGRFVVELGAQRVEGDLPGPKGRLLFGYLVLNRFRRIGRDELVMAVYGEDAAADHHPRLSVLLSKVRSVVGPDVVTGRAEIELALSREDFVDVEAAREGAHRAETHIANGEWSRAWGPAGVAYHVASRPLLQGHEAGWLTEWRRRLAEVRLRGLECLGTARLGLGGSLLIQAEECGRQLVALAPYRETGHRILMQALQRRGNVAEALLVYDRLRALLRDELGVSPSPESQRVYQQLLDASTSPA